MLLPKDELNVAELFRWRPLPLWLMLGVPPPPLALTVPDLLLQKESELLLILIWMLSLLYCMSVWLWR